MGFLKGGSQTFRRQPLDRIQETPLLPPAVPANAELSGARCPKKKEEASAYPRVRLSAWLGILAEF